MPKLCEICEDVVKLPVQANKCGHTVYLCETCKLVCSAALRYCVKCENAEVAADENDD